MSQQSLEILKRQQLSWVFPAASDTGNKELEEQRGEILFYRSTRQIKITADGERLAKQARFAVGSIDALFVKRHQGETR